MAIHLSLLGLLQLWTLRQKSGQKRNWGQIIKVIPGGSGDKESAWNAGDPGLDPLEKWVATHSSILTRRILQTEALKVYSPWGHKESDTTERLPTEVN